MPKRPPSTTLRMGGIMAPIPFQTLLGIVPENPSGKDRLFGTRLLEFDFSGVSPGVETAVSGDRRLPQTRIVESLLVRRASFRGFSAKVLFKLLHESFTRIQEVRVERWLEIYADHQTAYEQGTLEPILL